MSKLKKLTLENLLDRKSKQDKMGLSTIDIDSLNASVPIVKLKTRKMCEIVDKYEANIDENRIISGYDMMSEIIYKYVPMLQSKELQEQLNVPTPYEVVGELFNYKEMEKITEHILELHGMSDEKQTPVNDEIKN